MHKILITGATGFLGSHCMDLLDNEKYEIHATYRNQFVESKTKNVVWHKIDLYDIDKINELMDIIRPDRLLHLAWYMEPGLKLGNKIHHEWFEIGKNLVDSFVKFGGKKIVVSGSCAEYDWSCPLCSEDTTPLSPHNTYGKSKCLLQIYIDSLYKEGKLSYCWGRIFFMYGPGEKQSRLVPYVINSILNGEIAVIKSGHQVYDYLYVEDVARTLVSFLEIDVEGPINISSGHPVQIKELVLKIATLLNGLEYVKFESKEINDIAAMKLVGNNLKLKDELNWSPQFDLDKGLKKTIRYYQRKKQSEPI